MLRLTISVTALIISAYDFFYLKIMYGDVILWFLSNPLVSGDILTKRLIIFHYGKKLFVLNLLKINILYSYKLLFSI